MALPLTWLLAVFVANVVLGAALVVGVFAFMERQVAVGAVGGVALGALVIWGEATLGQRYLQVTVPEMKALVVVAALAAVVGVVGTVLVVEPEL